MQSEPTTAAEIYERARATRRYFASLRPPKPAQAVVEAASSPRPETARKMSTPVSQEFSPEWGYCEQPNSLVPFLGIQSYQGNAAVVPLVPKYTIRQIIDACALFYGVPAWEIVGFSRRKEIVTVRHKAVYLARVITGQSLPMIANKFGKRDHTTSLSSFRRVEVLLREDPSIRDEFAKIQEILKREYFSSTYAGNLAPLVRLRA